MENKKWNRKRILKTVGKVILALLALFVVLVLVIRTPWAQNYIVTKITDSISNKTDTKVAIDRAFITFSGDIQAEGIYLEDAQGDTLLFSKELQLDLPLYPLLFKNRLSIDNVEADGLVAKIKRGSNKDQFNFSFLIDAFSAPTDTTQTSEPMEISLGDFSLSDWRIDYEDDYMGTFIRLVLGTLETDIKQFDLNKMAFSLGDFEIGNTQINYNQTHPFPETNETDTVPSPKIKISQFELNEIHFGYGSIPDRLKTTGNIQNLFISDADVDLSNLKYTVDDILLKDSSIELALSQAMDSTQTEGSSFEWPEMELAANTIELVNNQFLYSQTGQQLSDSIFNPNAFKLIDLKVLAKDFSYQPKNVRLSLEDASVKETSGIHLRNLAFEAGLTEQETFIKKLNIAFNQSMAKADMQITYPSIQEALKNTKNSFADLSLSDLSIEPKDVKRFVPTLQKNRYLDSLSARPISGSLSARGTLKKIDDLEVNIQWGPETSLNAQGVLTNVTEKEAFTYNLNNIDIKTTHNDINKFISDTNTSFQVPSTIEIDGSLVGSLEAFETKSEIRFPKGNIYLRATANIGELKEINGMVKSDSLPLGTLLGNPQLGAISFELDASASGTALSNLDAKINGLIPVFEFQQYRYENITLNCIIKDGTGAADLVIKDKNLNFNADASIDLTSDKEAITFNANVIGADLRELGFTRRDIKMAAELMGTYSVGTNSYTVATTINNAIAVTDNEQYQITPIEINAHVEDSITDANIQSGFINGRLFSNASPARINLALKRQLESYFSTDSIVPNNLDNVKANLDLAIIPTPIISRVFFDGIQELDSLNIDASFDALTKKVSGKVIVPRFTYDGSSVDSLRVDVLGDSLDLKFLAGVSRFEYQPILLKNTYLEGNLKDKEMVLDFSSVSDTTTVMHISSELVFKKDTLKLHINPKNLVLNRKPWQIPEENGITLAESYSNFQNLVLSRNNQKLEVSTQIPRMDTDHIGIIFENFQLQTFLSLLNPEEPLAKGVVEGDFVILNPYDASGLVSKLEINEFRLMQNPLGSLSLNASSKSFSDYEIDLVLKDGGADLRLTGDYVAKQNDADLNLELDIKKLETSIVQGFFNDALSNPKGNISGSLLVNGTLSEPAYSGRINFTDVGFTLSAFKTDFKINGQQLDLNEEGINLNSFRINDSKNGSITLNGAITTENIFIPGFELSVEAQNFTALNSEKGDNDMVYGTVVIDTDLEVKGDLELPVIDGSLSIGDKTNLTYLVPQTQYEIQEREGVVIFVNRENPDAILTRNTGETASYVFSGMDINTTLEISEDAVFTIILDEKTQDKLQASGNASLNLNIDPNQDIRLSGRLELNSGFYRTSLYNLVSREFKISDGSSVTWSGDPYNAKLDVTAIYELETSATPLMSSISFGQDSGISGQYQRSSTFLVYLNVGGEITTPELSFALDMPENAQGSYGGAVYGRIQQLNEQESELNKQVFSLLALNRFYPTSGSDGSNGGAIALARNNVNKVLSSELNTISNKILGNSGFELDFDLDSFQDYQGDSYQNRTQLNVNASKKLFDDRLIVTAGSALDVEGSAANSESATPVIGNVMLEYLLTEEGTYRLKGFRRQEYQNIIDGQLIVTGLAFIFDREFNKFSQLFSPVKVKTEEDLEDNDNQNQEK